MRPRAKTKRRSTPETLGPLRDYVRRAVVYLGFGALRDEFVRTFVCDALTYRGVAGRFRA